MQTKKGKEKEKEFRASSDFMGSHKLQGEYGLYSEYESKTLENFVQEKYYML